MSQILNVVTIYSFVPYVGIVTILMNDYPKFKVFYLFSILSLQLFLTNCFPSIVRCAWCLGPFCTCPQGMSVLT